MCASVVYYFITVYLFYFFEYSEFVFLHYFVDGNMGYFIVYLS